MAKRKRKQSIGQMMRQINRQDRIAQGICGRPTVRFEDRKKTNNKRAARGRSWKGE
jgi:hypothetical protein